jgi:uncharacterized protein YukE
MNNQKSASNSKDEGNLRHNDRDYPDKYMPGNIAKNRTSLNINAIPNPLTVAQAYDKIFSPSVDKYNIKQKRSDRKIKDYHKHLFGISADDAKAKYSPVKNPKTEQQSFFEDLVQIGNMSDSGIIYEREEFIKGQKRIKHVDGEAVVKSISLDYDKVVEALKIYMFGSDELGIPSYQQRNPNFIVFAGKLHLDEATPHWHIDYIPIGTQYSGKRGMSVQLGYTKALSEMGFNGPKAYANWREKERQVLRDIGESLGMPMRSKEDEIKGQKHLSVIEFKDLMLKIEQAENEVEKLYADAENEIETTQIKLEIREINLEEGKKALNQCEAELEYREFLLEEDKKKVKIEAERNTKNDNILKKRYKRIQENEAKIKTEKSEIQAQKEELEAEKEALAESRKYIDRTVAEVNAAVKKFYSKIDELQEEIDKESQVWKNLQSAKEKSKDMAENLLERFSRESVTGTLKVESPQPSLEVDNTQFD